MSKRFDPEKEKEFILKAQSGDLNARKRLHAEYRGALDSIVYSNFRNAAIHYIVIRANAEKLLDKAIDTYNISMPNQPNTYLHGYVKDQLKRYVNNHLEELLVGPGVSDNTLIEELEKLDKEREDILKIEGYATKKIS